MAPVLSYTVVSGAASRQRLVAVHGAFGAGRNWGTVARRLVSQRPDWSIVLPDLRLHGQSQGFPPPHTLQTAAADLATLAQTLGGPVDALLGHSLGGKVALRFAASAPPGLRQVWVVDISPAPTPRGGSAWQMLEAVRALPRQFTSRAEAVNALVRRGFSVAVAQWMSTNLQQVGDRYRWHLDFTALEGLLDDTSESDQWGPVANPPDGVTIHFIQAADSTAVDETTVRRLRASGSGRVFVHTLPGGHWIHADNPGGVVGLLTRYLPAAVTPP